MSRTDRAALKLGRRLGQGGQGAVHEVLDRKINGQWDVVYKEYDPDVLRQLDVAALTAMTDLIGRLPGWDAAWLCDKTAWPAELVETGLGQLLVVLAEATTNARAAGLPLGTQHDLAILEDVATRAQRAAKHYRLRQLRKAYAKEHHHGS